MLRPSRTVALASCALIAASTPDLLAGAEPAPPVPLRIVTWNVLGGIGAPGSAEAIEFGKVITVQDLDGPGPNTGLVPDIVCLQELDSGNTSHLTAFRNTYLPGYTIRTANGDCCNYNAILVRPGITVLTAAGSSSFATPGPRDVVKIKVQPQGALRPVWLYGAHFKAFGDAPSQATRTQEANAVGNNASFELNFGGGVNVVVCGDLNSNNNSDNTLDGLFAAELENIAVETLNGRTSGSTIIATYPGTGSRLDYVCPDSDLASFFDADMSGTYSQTEKNAMGFVYYSSEDAGKQSNGDTNATNSFSDHRPVVFDLYLPRDPMLPYYPPVDVSQNGSVDAEDLYQWETAYALGVAPSPNPAPDLDGDRNIDPQDHELLHGLVREAEVGDTTGQP